MEKDYYAILGVEFGASEKEIRKAYRLKSLTCHPDKVGAEDTKAAELFQLINLAVDVLSDPEKRKNYDDLHKAEQLRKKRFEEMNKNRQEAKSKLEEREKEAKRARFEAYSKDVQDKLNIERIKEETQRKMKARQEMRRQEVAVNMSIVNSINEAKSIIQNATVPDCTVKVKWSKGLDVDEVRLRNTFSKFGDIELIFMSKTGKRMARVVFKHVKSAFDAVHHDYQSEFKVESIVEPEPKAFDCIRTNMSDNVHSFTRSNPLNRGDEYESITLQKLQEKQKPV